MVDIPLASLFGGSMELLVLLAGVDAPGALAAIPGAYCASLPHDRRSTQGVISATIHLQARGSSEAMVQHQTPDFLPSP